MAWIKLQQSLREHKKIIRLAEILDMPEPHVAGHCAFLWLWCVDNAGDGILPDTVRTVEKAAGWEGQRGAFYQAMLEVGFLDPVDDSLSVHDWEEYNGAYHDKRKREATKGRVQKHRKNKNSAQKTEIDDVTRYTIVTHALRDVQKDTKNDDVTLLDLDRDLELESTKELKDEEEEYAHTREDDSTSDPQDAFDIPTPSDDEEPSALGAMWRECEEIFPLRFNSIQVAKIEAYVTDDGMEPELIVETLRDARLLGKGLDYALGILRNKHAEGIRTLDEYRMSQEIFQAKKAAKTNETRAAPNANRNADALLRSMQKMGVTISSTGGT